MSGFSFHSSESSGGTTSTWTVTSKVLPAGTLFFAVGWYRSAGSAQRTLDSITHTGITSAAVVTTDDGQTARYFFGSDPDYVVGLELWKTESTGGTGDLVLTFSNTVWSPALAIFIASDVGDALTLGTGTAGTGSSVSTSASDSGAAFGLASMYAAISDNAATLTPSPWTSGLATMTPSNYRRFSAVYSNATTGVSQSFSIDSGNFLTAAAQEVLFAPAARSAMMMAA